MSLFLTVVSVEEAVRSVQDLAPALEREMIPLASSFHRILAEDVRADVDIPGFDRSVVDGYALQARDTVGASDALPAILWYRGRIPMGSPPSFALHPDECAYIPTGGVLPKGANGVAMIEYSEQMEDEVLVHRPVAAGENVIQHDEDFAKGIVVLPRGHFIRPQDMGILAAAGAIHVPVYATPRVGIISTGTELIPPETVPIPGEIRDANSFMISGFLQEHGCHPRQYGIISDEGTLIRDTLVRAVKECDVVILSGGSSKDLRDVTAQVIGELGEVRVHGISLQPGKPTIVGRIGKTPVIGLPGHPASAFIVLWVIVRPLLEQMMSRSFPVQKIPAILAESVPSPKGREDYVRVRLQDGKAIPLFGKSGLLNTLVQSDGMIQIPAESEGLEGGTPVKVILW